MRTGQADCGTFSRQCRVSPRIAQTRNHPTFPPFENRAHVCSSSGHRGRLVPAVVGCRAPDRTRSEPSAKEIWQRLCTTQRLACRALAHTSTFSSPWPVQLPKLPRASISLPQRQVLKPSHGTLKLLVGKLAEDDSTAEAAAWNLWGLVSTWNPNWQQNQEALDNLLERDEVDVLHELARLLHRAAAPVRLRALGALAQLPYLSSMFKRRAASAPSLLAALAALFDEDGFNSEAGAPTSYAGMQLQMRAARAFAALCSTPCAHSEVAHPFAPKPTPRPPHTLRRRAPICACPPTLRNPPGSAAAEGRRTSRGAPHDH